MLCLFSHEVTLRETEGERQEGGGTQSGKETEGKDTVGVRYCKVRDTVSGKNLITLHCKPSPFGKQFCLAYTAIFPSYITFQNTQKKIFNPKQM
jgi:hypothetical protein